MIIFNYAKLSRWEWRWVDELCVALCKNVCHDVCMLEGLVEICTYWVGCSDGSRSLGANIRMCHGARANNGIRLQLSSPRRCWARRRCFWTPASSLIARCEPWAHPGRGCHRILMSEEFREHLDKPIKTHRICLKKKTNTNTTPELTF